ncbi:MAG: AI-2E family transporter, partial [bacterium]
MNQETKHYSISISTGSVIRGTLFIVLLLFLYYIRDIVLVILAAVVIASAIEPLTKWFGKYRIHRLAAVVFTYLVLLAVLAGFLVFFVPTLVNQALTYISSIPPTINIGDIWNPLRDTTFLSSTSFSTQDVVNNLQQVIAGTSAGAFKTAAYLFGGALSFLLIILLSFYLAVQEDGVANFLRIVTPVRKHKYVIDLWKRSQVKIGHWMQGQLLLGVIIGMLVYLGLMVLGIQHALLLSFLAACFELVPVFGPILSSIPAIIVGLTAGGASEGLLVAG